MNAKLRIAAILIFVISIALSGCGPRPAPAPTSTPPLYKDPSQPIDARVENLLSLMTLDEKIGQMAQVEDGSITPEELARYSIGSVLTGGDSRFQNNTLADWTGLVRAYQDQALKTRLGIPMIYGIDSVHGFAHVNGATVFPHNIGLGAADDPELVRKLGQMTAEEMLAAGIPWNFAPMLCVPQDIRWGRIYEGFSEDTALVTRLAAAYVEGFQDAVQTPSGGTLLAGATAKAYMGDGGTTYGTSPHIPELYLLDQGDTRYDEAAVRRLFVPPYQATVDKGVMSVMISFSSWNGVKMHANKHAITDILKGELGFKGFVISDWGGIDWINDDYEQAIVTAVNAGIDMDMVPYDYKRFISVMDRAVAKGEITQARVDDAVRRILRAKMQIGLFEHPYGDPALAATVGSPEHRELARQAVRESLVLLKNDNDALPVAKDAPAIFVSGGSADSVGLQLGGWSLSWQGSATANATGATSILSAIKAAVSPGTKVVYDRDGQFEGRAEYGIVVVGEGPYAEGLGDRVDLSLSGPHKFAIANTRAHVDKLIVVLISGRPLVITDQFNQADAWVAAWQPGSEGAGVTDVLFGDAPFTGKLPYSWPRSNAQLPINENNSASKTGCDAPLFPFGYGLGQAGAQPIQWIDCP